MQCVRCCARLRVVWRVRARARLRECHFGCRSLRAQGTSIQAEYIWIGGSGQDIRCKTMTLTAPPSSLDDLPIWNFDGSSTGQAPGHDSEVLLRPVRMVPDPSRGHPNILVLCECLKPDMTPVRTNTRQAAVERFKRDLSAAPWFGLEQEYTLFNTDKRTPLGWPKDGYPGPQGPYYCGVGADNSFGRRIVEAHYRACLFAGLKISGINAEVMPGQWEFQIGPAEGIEAGDHLWLARYLLQRIAEEFGVVVSFDPKPIPGDWNGAGCHTNFSTKIMRESDSGYAEILKAVDRLGKHHLRHIRAYGEGNERRLTGRHETAPIDRFSYGVANRGASIRIPRSTEAKGKGYFEDRRPASSMDPYVVTSMVFETSCFDDIIDIPAPAAGAVATH
jgi:glutamine synthetase